MRKLCYPLLLVLAVGLSACARSRPETAIPTIVLDSPSAGPAAGGSGVVTASAVVVPVRHADLGFPLTGVIAAVDVEVGEPAHAGDTLATLGTEILEARVAEAEADVSAARAQLNYLIRQGEDEVHLQAARAEIDRVQASLDGAAAVLGQATLTAPFDGTIAAVHVATGETVVPGQVVLILGDLTSFRIETTDLSERDVPDVRVGQPATIFIEALSKEITGRVKDISHAAESLGGDVVYRVTLALDEQPQGLRWGMSAEVTISTSK